MIRYANGLITVTDKCSLVMVRKGTRKYHSKNLSGLPLPYGDGKYNIDTYQHITGNRYRRLRTYTSNYKNTGQYMLEYNSMIPMVPEAAEKAKELADGKTQLEAFNAITDWITHHMVYDVLKSVRVGKEENPDPQGCWDKRKGICQDISSLTVGMLRSVGIPSNMCVGYCAGRAHAWVESNIGGKTERYDFNTAKKPPVKRAKYKYTYSRWY